MPHNFYEVLVYAGADGTPPAPPPSHSSPWRTRYSRLLYMASATFRVARTSRPPPANFRLRSPRLIREEVPTFALQMGFVTLYSVAECDRYVRPTPNVTRKFFERREEVFSWTGRRRVSYCAEVIICNVCVWVEVSAVVFYIIRKMQTDVEVNRIASTWNWIVDS